MGQVAVGLDYAYEGCRKVATRKWGREVHHPCMYECILGHPVSNVSAEQKQMVLLCWSTFSTSRPCVRRLCFLSCGIPDAWEYIWDLLTMLQKDFTSTVELILKFPHSTFEVDLTKKMWAQVKFYS